MWWISYRGEGKSGVENIGVFEDDGTPRKEHPLLLDPSPDAEKLHIARGFAAGRGVFFRMAGRQVPPAGTATTVPSGRAEGCN